MSENDSRFDPQEMEALADRILDQEIRALTELKGQMNPNSLAQALQEILSCSGKVLVVGSGTSSTIARRLAHTLTCSGAPSVFLDSGQAQHGYSGLISEQDLVLAFSRGGESDEVNHVLRVARGRGAQVIGVMEKTDSSMAQLSDVVLSAKVSPENDAVGVIPLASTLAHAAVGDVLCAAVYEVSGYGEEEFAALHPGGAVGKQLSGDDPPTPPVQGPAAPAPSQASPPETQTVREYDALRTLQGMILDMDGVLWRGPNPLPGLRDFIDVLEQRGIRYVLATNNPSKKPQGFAQKAASMGVHVDPEQIVTSSTATVHYLKQHYPPGSRVHVIGEKDLKDQVEAAGYVLANEDVVAVVVALERSMTYETIKRGSLLIRSGAEFIGTNADPSYPTEEGIVPGSGMMVAALAASANRKPTIMGKPERTIFDLALQRLELPPHKIASVGDRLDTDILGAKRLGMKTILVLSGIVTTDDLAASPIKPTWVFPGIEELTAALRDDAAAST